MRASGHQGKWAIKLKLKIAGYLAFATVLLAPRGSVDIQQTARPGTLNYVEGQAIVEDGSPRIKVKGGREVDLAGVSRSEQRNSTREHPRKKNSIAGPVCDPLTLQKPTPMRRRATLAENSGGSATGGIGIPGSIRSRSFPATGSSTAHSDGDFIHPGMSMRRRSLVARTTVTLPRTTMLGVLALTMASPPIMDVECTTDQEQVLVSPTRGEL
jgi:hypothetical protein